MSSWSSPAARIGALALVWGTSFLFIKVALDGLSATQVVVGRLLFGAAALAAVVAVRRVPLPRSPRIWGHLVLMGVVANLLPFFLFAWGEGHGAPSGLAGIYNATTPLWTLMVAVAALPEERPTVARAAGIVVGFLGVVVVLGPWHEAVGAKLGGQLACLGAAACYGVGFVYTRRFLARSGLRPLALSTGQIGAAAVLGLLLTPFVAADPVTLPLRVVGSVLVLGALGTGIAYIVYFGLIRDVGATTASSVTYFTPLVAVTLGALVLSEQVGWNTFVGALVVVTGVALAEGRLAGFRQRFPLP